MTLTRRSFGPSGPFETVDTETGETHMQCTRCAGHAKFYDTLAMIHLKSSPFAVARLLLLTPWAIAGFLRFATGHLHCIEADL